MRYNIDDIKYEKLVACVSAINDSNKCNLILECCKDKLYFHTYNAKTNFFVYDENTQIWNIETDNQLIFRFIQIMQDLFRDYRATTQEENLEQQSRSKEYNKNFQTVRVGSGDMKFYKDVVDYVRHHPQVYDDSIFEKIDKYTGKIQFLNGSLNLQTMKLEKRNKNDYVTRCLPYKYEPKIIKKTDKKKMKASLLNIANSSEDQYKTLMSWIAYQLNGDNICQLFGNLYGPSAGNGKSTIMDIARKVFDMYTLTMNSQTFNTSYDKKHKVFDGIKPYTRICTVEEPNDGEKLDITQLKDFCSAKNISIEVLYGTTRMVNINCVVNFISNYILKFNVDNGIQRRGVIFEFKNKFVDADEFEQTIENGHDQEKLFVKDENFIKSFDDNHNKLVFISLLLDVIKEVGYGKIHSLNEIKDKWKTACEINDNFFDFLDSTFEITRNNTDFVTKEVFLDYYKAHNKINNIALTTLLNHIKKNNLVYDKNKMINGKKGVIYGIREKDEEPEESLFDRNVKKESQEVPQAEIDILKHELEKLRAQIAELTKIETAYESIDKKLFVKADPKPKKYKSELLDILNM